MPEPLHTAPADEIEAILWRLDKVKKLGRDTVPAKTYINDLEYLLKQLKPNA